MVIGEILVDAPIEVGVRARAYLISWIQRIAYERPELDESNLGGLFEVLRPELERHVSLRRFRVVLAHRDPDGWRALRDAGKPVDIRVRLTRAAEYSSFERRNAARDAPPEVVGPELDLSVRPPRYMPGGAYVLDSAQPMYQRDIGTQIYIGADGRVRRERIGLGEVGIVGIVRAIEPDGTVEVVIGADPGPEVAAGGGRRVIERGQWPGARFHQIASFDPEAAHRLAEMMELGDLGRGRIFHSRGRAGDELLLTIELHMRPFHLAHLVRGDDASRLLEGVGDTELAYQHAEFLATRWMELAAAHRGGKRPSIRQRKLEIAATMASLGDELAGLQARLAIGGMEDDPV